MHFFRDKVGERVSFESVANAPPAGASRVNKKKLFKKAAPGLATRADCVAAWDGASCVGCVCTRTQTTAHTRTSTYGHDGEAAGFFVSSEPVTVRAGSVDLCCGCVCVLAIVLAIVLVRAAAARLGSASGHAMVTSAGPVTVPSLASLPIK